MRRWGIICLMCISLWGCTQSPSSMVAEQEETAFRRGKQRLREGRPDEALQAFLSVIDKRHDAPESHLEAGLLYLNRFNEPVLSIYHFNEYLRARPNSDQADRVKQLIVSAKKEFARSLPASPFGGEVDKLDLKELLDKTRAENESLKTEITKARDEIERYKTLEETRRSIASQPIGPQGGPSIPVTGSSARAMAPAPAAQSPTRTATTKPSTKSDTGPRAYVVQQGDTLSSIAQKMYGASSRWKSIYEANRITLPTPSALKIGQTLIIP